MITSSALRNASLLAAALLLAACTPGAADSSGPAVPSSIGETSPTGRETSASPSPRTGASTPQTAHPTSAESSTTQTPAVSASPEPGHPTSADSSTSQSPVGSSSPAPTGSATPSENPSESSSCPQAVPSELGLDPFYDQYCDVSGIPLIADQVVDPEALQVAAEYMRQMLATRPDVAEMLSELEIRAGLIGRDQQTTDMPEWSDLDEAFPGTDWDIRTRGVGATEERPLVGAGEENLLCLEVDRYYGESIFVHEFSHTVLQLGVERLDPGFRTEIVQAYDLALAEDRWTGTYAATNPDEYWAEGVQSFFDTNLSDDSQHNEVDTRAELSSYDPALFALIEEVFGDGSWRPECP